VRDSALNGVGKDITPLFFRVTQAGPYRYLQIARSYRDGHSVRQQTLVSLRRLELLQASGQLEDLLRSGLRLTSASGPSSTALANPIRMFSKSSPPAWPPAVTPPGIS
jgi:hypothetical protein